MNWKNLISIPSESEIKYGVFQMEALKSPGPDGYLVRFFQCMWKVVGPNIIKTGQNFFKYNPS